MIAFPKFYYKRPDEWTFLVSNDPIDGFYPSPMHYKRLTVGGDKVLSDYVYVSEFKYGIQISQPSDCIIGRPVSDYRSIAKTNGMRLIDIETRMMVNILAIIKYANLDTQNVIGIGLNDPHAKKIGITVNLMVIVSLDSGHIKVMGLMDWYGIILEFTGNAMINQYRLYINDSKDVDSYHQ